MTMTMTRSSLVRWLREGLRWEATCSLVAPRRLPMLRTPRVTASRAAVLIASAALFVALDGPSLAAAVIDSGDVKNNSLKGADIKNDSVKGKDILESSLAKVPSASSADTVPDGSLTGAKVQDR